jgi:hypothetical protein
MDMTEGSETSAKLNLTIFIQPLKMDLTEGLRNVGKIQSDAEEIPKRKHTTYQTHVVWRNVRGILKLLAGVVLASFRFRPVYIPPLFVMFGDTLNLAASVDAVEDK